MPVAWKKILDTMIELFYKKCCITNALNGTDDAIVWKITGVNNSYTKHDLVELNLKYEKAFQMSYLFCLCFLFYICIRVIYNPE